jgi:large subunit ribosomal protein L10
MPNLVNNLLYEHIARDVETMGSCLVIAFDKLTVADAEQLRKKFRGAGFRYRVVKNQLAIKAFQTKLSLDMAPAFEGKCGLLFAKEETAIAAAKLVREASAAMAQKNKAKFSPIKVTGGVIERQPILGKAAATIADMPDRNTVRAQLARAIIAPLRGLAVALNGVAGGTARCMQAKVDKAGEGS